MKDVVMGWAQWLGGSRLSSWLAVHEWAVPTSQSLHILGVGVVFTSALMISLNLLGVRRQGRSVAQLVAALTPWMYAALVLIVLTGAIQVMAEPAREFVGDVFWWKMGLVALVIPLTVGFATVVRRNADQWDGPQAIPLGGRLFGGVSLLLWVAIIFCGRFIAYTFSFFT